MLTSIVPINCPCTWDPFKSRKTTRIRLPWCWMGIENCSSWLLSWIFNNDRSRIWSRPWFWSVTFPERHMGRLGTMVSTERKRWSETSLCWNIHQSECLCCVCDYSCCPEWCFTSYESYFFFWQYGREAVGLHSWDKPIHVYKSNFSGRWETGQRRSSQSLPWEAGSNTIRPEGRGRSSISKALCQWRGYRTIG